MIALTHVSLRFEDKQVLADLSFALAKGRVTCLLGRSGCGKTTLLRVMAGLLTPDDGRVMMPEGMRASFVFQEDRLLPWRDALGNLLAVGIDETAARAALEGVLLGDDLHTRPADMSGGMRRRLAIARGMARPADVYFLDEPLRGLDPVTAAPVLALMRQTLRGRTALLITHSPEEAHALSDVLVHVDGPPLRVLRTAETRDFADVEALRQWIGSPS